ncbi:hypothetical protein BJ742DRAFT_341987 [Cladochytrium replicatum]|nr:hypothetical protein BJ742DRAFT_341987 [Cladochytrium replicatum]
MSKPLIPISQFSPTQKPTSASMALSPPQPLPHLQNYLSLLSHFDLIEHSKFTESASKTTVAPAVSAASHPLWSHYEPHCGTIVTVRAEGIVELWKEDVDGGEDTGSQTRRKWPCERFRLNAEAARPGGGSSATGSAASSGSQVVRVARLSRDRKFLAIVRSAKVMEVVVLKPSNGPSYPETQISPVIFRAVRDGKKSDAILGVEWTFDKDMLMVTSAGIEFYHLSLSKQTLVHKRTVSFAVTFYIYSREHQLLILSSGGLTLTLWTLKPGAQFSAPSSRAGTLKLEVNDKSGSKGIGAMFSVKNLTGSGPVVTRKHVHIVTLYDQAYCAYVGPGVGGRGARLWLHRVGGSGKSDMSRGRNREVVEVALSRGGIFVMSVVDNLLLAHNITERETATVDVMAGKSSRVAIIGRFKYNPSLSIEQYADDWQSHSPNWIFVPSTTTLLRVAVDIPVMADCLRDTLMNSFARSLYDSDLAILGVILRRAEASGISPVLLVREMVERETGGMKRTWELVAKGYAKIPGRDDDVSPEEGDAKSALSSSMRTPSVKRVIVGGSIVRVPSPPVTKNSPGPVRAREADLDEEEEGVWYGGTSISQEDMYTKVFWELTKETTDLNYVSQCLFEYIAAINAASARSSGPNNADPGGSIAVHPEPFLHELLAELLLTRGNSAELQQYLRAGIVEGTVGIGWMWVRRGQAALWANRTTSTVRSRSASANASSSDGNAHFERVDAGGGAVALSEAEAERSVRTGIGIMKRLGAHEDVMEVYLRWGKPLDALQYALEVAHSSVGPDLSSIPNDLMGFIRGTGTGHPLGSASTASNSAGGGISSGMLTRSNLAAGNERGSAAIEIERAASVLLHMISQVPGQSGLSTPPVGKPVGTASSTGREGLTGGGGGVVYILDIAYQSGDKTVFLNVYKTLEMYGLIPEEAAGGGVDGVGVGTGASAGRNGMMMGTAEAVALGRFVSIYRELWGEVVAMEEIGFLS